MENGEDGDIPDEGDAHFDRQDRKVNHPELIQEQRAMDSYLTQLTNYKRLQQSKRKQ